MQTNWTLGKITAGVRWSRDQAGKEHIERPLSFARLLTAGRKAQLLEVAAATPVTSVIGAGIEIRSAVMDRGDL
jgi:hypothetical protein